MIPLRVELRGVDSGVLAPTARPFPDKWHGITDPDLRYRQRYVDLWVTDEARRTFLFRSRMLSLMRRWLEERGFVEVETPVLHPIPGGALAKPFATTHNALGIELYLRIAPELTDADRGGRMARVSRSAASQRGHRIPVEPGVTSSSSTGLPRYTT